MLFSGRFVLAASMIALVVGAPPGATAAEITEAAPGPGLGADLGPGKPVGAWAKADGAVRGVVAQFRQHMERGAPETFQPANPTLQHSRGRLVVDIVAEDDPEALMADLRRFGMRDASRYGKVISGSLPIGVIAQVIELQGLRAISAARIPMNNETATPLIDEGPKALNSDLTPASGFSGAGVTIGVLSDSFDQKGGYAGTVGTHLPAGVKVLDDSANCGNPCSDEGRAMMELIYDVAPGAALAFNTAFVGGKAGFANGILALAAPEPDGAAADIIVDDVIYFTEAMFQDDVIARAVDQVKADGVAYFSSAGNFARVSYEAPYRASGEPLITNNEDRGELHDFDPGSGVDWHQHFKVPSGLSHRIVTLVLQWDQPFGSLSTGNRAAANDVDIYITDTADPATVLASSVDNNSTLNGGSGEPIELLQFQVGGCDFFYLLSGYGCVTAGDHRLLISLYSGAAPGKMKFVMFNHSITFPEWPADAGSLFGHANAAGAQAVGAAYWVATPRFCDLDPMSSADDPTWDDCETNGAGQPSAQLEYFSAAGGTPILFDQSGKAIGQTDAYADPRIKKPEVVGPDGTNTTFFFADTTRDEDSYPNFFGTSAAAPHVAAVGALMLEADPSLTPDGMHAGLESTALNMNPRPAGSPEDADGFDFDTGWGFVQADLAVAAVSGGGTGNSPPAAVIAYSCSELDCTFDGTGSTDSDGTIDSYAWDFGDGSTATGATPPLHSYESGGDYTVTLTVTDSDGATGQATETVSVAAANVPPTADFTVATTDLTADFTDASGDSDGTVASWSWDFGDGNTATAQNPSHTYAAAADYTVTLTVTDDDGGTGSASKTITVTDPVPNDPPTAAFSYTTSDLTVSFTDESTDSDGTVNDHAWSFGDGSGSTAQSPSHTYAAAGDYLVTLTVTDDDGATDDASLTVTVTEPVEPVISLSVNTYKVKGLQHADLAWSGATSTNVDVKRDGVNIAGGTPNDGEYTDSTSDRGGGSANYQVCEAGTTTCSSVETAIW